MVINLQLQKVQYKEGWRQVAGLHKDELILMKFSSKEKELLLEWKNEMEFQFEGEMYDVVESEQHNDSTHYWVWWDHEETKVIKNLYKLISITESNPEIKYILTSLYFRSVFYSEITTDFIEPHFRLAQYSPYCARLYLSLAYTPPSPPPKV